MTPEEFATACAAIETIALNNSHVLEHRYDTCREDVEAVVRMARWTWAHDQVAAQAMADV